MARICNGAGQNEEVHSKHRRHSACQQSKCSSHAEITPPVQLQGLLIKILSHGRKKPRGADEGNVAGLPQKPDA